MKSGISISTDNEDSIQVLLREWCRPGNIPKTGNGAAPEWAYSNTSAYIKDLINSFWSTDFSRESHYIRLEINSVPNFQNERRYEDIPFPSQPLQLLSLFRFWNAVQYYYPNIGSIPNWDEVLEEYIPIFMNAESKQEYISSLNRLSHEVFDGHSQVYARATLTEYCTAQRNRTWRLSSSAINYMSQALVKAHAQ